ncbi:MAG: IS1595 family transposase [Actinomycetota bacterium]|nr:IS1595 family transposase [Actinomycetota bacterium]
MTQTATRKRQDPEVRMDTNLVNRIERFGSEDRCRAYLEHLRWPEGVECPKCGSKSISRIKTRAQFDCNSCRHRFSVTAGTVFHDSHLKLWKWFLGVYMMCESKKGMSANQLKRTLGVSYKTAWYLCHRIRFAMAEANQEPLGVDGGVAEIDETYVGGRPRSGSKKAKGAGGGTAHLDMVLGALERGWKLHLKLEPERRNARTLQGFVLDQVDPDAAAIYTDQHSGYRGMAEYDNRHAFVDHTQEEWVRGDVSTNGIESAWSLFERSIVGSFHQLSTKHLDAYLDEFAFRFNNRKNPYLFRDTLIKLCQADVLPYKVLTA